MVKTARESLVVCTATFWALCPLMSSSKPTLVYASYKPATAGTAVGANFAWRDHFDSEFSRAHALPQTLFVVLSVLVLELLA